MFVDLDWPLNASSLLSASAELLVTSEVLRVWKGFDICSLVQRNTKRSGGISCRPHTWQYRYILFQKLEWRFVQRYFVRKPHIQVRRQPATPTTMLWVLWRRTLCDLSYYLVIFILFVEEGLTFEKKFIQQIYTVSRKKWTLKDFATTSVNLHQIKYIFTHIQPHLFQTTSVKFLENNSYSDVRNHTVNKITQKLDYTA